MPVHIQVPLFIKKGTSAPTLAPIFISLSSLNFKLNNLLIRIITAAASLLPPARPAPEGIFFFIKISRPSLIENSFCIRAAAFMQVFLSSVGIFFSSSLK